MTTETPAYPAIGVPGRWAMHGFRLEVGMVAVPCIAVVAALWFAGSNGHLLRVALLAATTLIGLFLYLRQPVLYVQYALWVWFLAALVRRVVDFRFGWTDPNLILFAPPLVSGIAGLSLLRERNRVLSGLPPVFGLCGAAILYGFAVGAWLRPIPETAYAFLTWLCPMLFGLHLYLNWPQYREHREVIVRSFLWAVLLVGVYGIYQFLDPPAWDCYWLENIRAAAPDSSFGLPEPLLVRVWSTVNAPGPFADTMFVGLLLLFGVRSPLKLPAAVAGYTSLLLSAVRAAWLSWVIGVLWIVKDASARVKARILFSIVLFVACLLPVIRLPDLGQVIGPRLNTFADLEHDASLGARLEMYRQLLGDVAVNPFGRGLSNDQVFHGYALDSGLIAAALSLGWLGTLLLGLAICTLFVGKRRLSRTTDDFTKACKAILIAFLAQLLGGNIFVSVTGAMFWMFAGMYLAADKYYAHGARL
ncbi:MAG: hypothetical protein ABSF59_22775 [Candidatus Sulfotelmatobacter sp.]|jgi:hypothetical protein